MTSRSSSKPRIATYARQGWILKSGLIIGAAILIFLGYLVLRSIEGRQVPCESRPILVMLFALGTALASAFIGGDAAASGKLPLPFAKDHPIAFGVTGGFALLVVVWAFGTFSYSSQRECQSSTVNISATVLDDAGYPIEGAMLTVDGFDTEALSDANGVLFGRVTGVRLDQSIVVRITRKGHQAFSRSFSVHGSSLHVPDPRLLRDTPSP